MSKTNPDAVPNLESKNSSASIPQAKVSAISRFTSLFSQNREAIVFPPPTWALGDSKNEGAGASSVPILQKPSQKSEKEKDVEKENEPETPAVDQTTAPVSTGTTETDEKPPEPTNLANRIKSMIDSLPNMRAGNAPANPPPQPLPELDGPINLNDPKSNPFVNLPGSDSKLVQWLSSEAVMNGSIGKGSESVWSALQQLRPAKEDSEKQSDSASKKEGKTNEGSTTESSGSESESEDEENVMMYAPINPTKDSKVEIAEADKGSAPESQAKDGEVLLPKPDEAKDEEKEGKVKKSKKKSKSRKKPKERVPFKPHPTKLSLEATWWGIRIYLPPAVLNALDENHVVAAQRAAMITASLKWLLDSLPLMVVPANYRPVLTAIKGLTPYLGYLGLVITWSWGKIKQLDEGNGVILSSTWICPAALIPATWKPGQPAAKEVKDGTGKANIPSASTKGVPSSEPSMYESATIASSAAMEAGKSTATAVSGGAGNLIGTLKSRWGSRKGKKTPATESTSEDSASAGVNKTEAASSEGQKDAGTKTPSEGKAEAENVPKDGN